MLAGMSFPNTLKILHDPNVWITDTGTTVHNLPYLFGIEGQKVTKDESLTMGNGKAEATLVIGNLVGTMCDWKGNQVGRAKFKKVNVVPNGKFNLFSVTKMQMNG